VGADALGEGRELREGGSRACTPRAAAPRAGRARHSGGAAPASGRSPVVGAALLAMIVVGHTRRRGAVSRGGGGAGPAPLGVLAPVAFVAGVPWPATLIGVPGMPFTLLSPFLFGA